MHSSFPALVGAQEFVVEQLQVEVSKWSWCPWTDQCGKLNVSLLIRKLLKIPTNTIIFHYQKSKKTIVKTLYTIYDNFFE